MQSVALSGLLAAKDSVTPLKVGGSGVGNFWGSFLEVEWFLADFL